MGLKGIVGCEEAERAEAPPLPAERSPGVLGMVRLELGRGGLWRPTMVGSEEGGGRKGRYERELLSRGGGR
jgi:hypothetical protein